MNKHAISWRELNPPADKLTKQDKFLLLLALATFLAQAYFVTPY